MPNTKITAMPSLAGNQVPTDLVTAVDLSAAPVNQNVKSTLNDLFSTITKNITDRAIRFQAPGSAPAVSSANQGALYHNGTAFLASSNGGAFEQLYTLSAQSAALVFAGPTSGPAATPTFRALALTDLPQIATDSLLGRVSGGTGTPEQITSTAALLTWLQNPSSANLIAAVTDETGGGLAGTGLLVFNDGPTIITPTIANIRSGSGQTALRLTGTGSNNFVEIVNAAQPTGPTIQAIGTPQADISLLIKSKGTGNVDITGSAIRAFGPTIGSNTNPGILEARGGNQQFGGGKIYLYERSNNGSNYVGFEAPDSLASDLFWTLPNVDGTPGQALVTDGGSGLSWASFVSNSIATNTFLGRTAAGTGPVQTLTAGSGVLTWLQTPTSANLAAAVSDETGSGALVFGTSPALQSISHTGAATFANVADEALLTINNSGRGNSLRINDVVNDTTPIVVTGDGQFIVGGAAANSAFPAIHVQDIPTSAFIGGVDVANIAPQAIRLTPTIPNIGTTMSSASMITTFPSVASGATVNNFFHYRAFTNSFSGATIINQFAFSAESSITGAGINYGFFSAVLATANNFSFFSAAGSANSRFAGQVLHEAGSAAAPSITIDGDLNTGLAQIGGADTISISTGGTERLRAKSGGAIRFIPLTAAPASPESGDVYYNSTTNKLQVYNGTAWQDCN